ncbi:flavin monoamine oxidase family protein [Actinoplanes sp. RD1]|uniref:flavin monoamine oxidase family protein n=1 Tax=Actinoplanes sp. RD1 TaxID=3064538 RepID=UPI0027412B6B|nr:FAD-dependent oxidoreductase [Actinoplanes sp. RD1]
MRAFAVSRWGEDPWSGGSWSLIGRDGTPADRTALGSPIGNRLRLAGEATHATRAGMTHGAYEQGAEAGAWAATLGHARIAVVGAGVAGLAAAREAAGRGLSVDVWEARDRIGGRAAGIDVGGFAFDLGANWLQQYPGNVLARLAEGLGLTTVPTDFTDPLVLAVPSGRQGDAPAPGGMGGGGVRSPGLRGGRVRSLGPRAGAGRATHSSRALKQPAPVPDELEHGPAGGAGTDEMEHGPAGGAGTGELERDLRRRLAGAAEGASIADVVEAWQRDPGPWTARAIRRFADAEIVMDAGVPLSFLSARHGFEPGVGEGDRWIVGSYRRLVDHLAEGLTIRRRRPVRRIRHGDDGVVLSGDGVSERFDAAIVTVPVGVLRAGRIAFEPALPRAHAGALGRLGMGRVEKVVLRCERRFWPVHDSGYYRVHGPGDGDISEWLDASAADGAPTLVGLFAGPWLEPLWNGSDAEVARRAMDVFTTAVTHHRSQPRGGRGAGAASRPRPGGGPARR